ncbi:MAG: hypothetical protein LBJ88_04345 [Campylobacteraceae bacterium]|nr:hypothetical protein [Campylobacteraceae bacterium]
MSMGEKLNACDIAGEIRDLVAVVSLGFVCDNNEIDKREKDGLGLLCLMIEQKAGQIIELLSEKSD